MRAHLDDLAVAYNASLQERGGLSSTDARLMHQPNRPDAGAVVLIKPLRDRRDYFDGLHEFGHLHAIRHGEVKRMNYSHFVDGRLLWDEAYAWDWALANARFPATPTIAVNILNLLWSRAQDTGDRVGQRDHYGVGVVEDDCGLGTEYQAVIDHIESVRRGDCPPNLGPQAVTLSRASQAMRTRMCPGHGPGWICAKSLAKRGE